MLVAVGPLRRRDGAAFDGETHAVADAAEAAALVAELVRAGDTVLVKASRGVGLEASPSARDGALRAPAWARS